jgi:hypothetical protein
MKKMGFAYSSASSEDASKIDRVNQGDLMNL